MVGEWSRLMGTGKAHLTDHSLTSVQGEAGTSSLVCICSWWPILGLGGPEIGAGSLLAMPNNCGLTYAFSQSLGVGSIHVAILPSCHNMTPNHYNCRNMNIVG